MDARMVIGLLACGLFIGGAGCGNSQNNDPDGGDPDGGQDTWCDSYTPPPASTDTPCRSVDDCPDGTCWAPGATGPFYALGFCPRDCEADADCQEGVCVPFNGGFDCAQCLPACSTGGCHLWETCGADGHCRPTSCEDGYTCPPGATCAPGSGGTDAHGCVLQSCTDDAQCDCGACVLGYCQAGPGRCEPMKA